MGIPIPHTPTHVKIVILDIISYICSMYPNIDIRLETTLGAGVTTLYTNTNSLVVTINSITFNNPAAYAITLTVNRANPVSNINAYSFTLAAGDVVKDNNIYLLKKGDSISVNCSVAGTNCLLYGQILYGVSSLT